MSRTRVILGLMVKTFALITIEPSWLGADNLSLGQTYPESHLAEILVSRDDWRPVPTLAERAAWTQLPEVMRRSFVEVADKYKDQTVPSLSATLYLQYKRTGNRSNYQGVWYERRRMLHTMVIAECIQGEQRYLDAIANVLWAICEESSWTWPAHIAAQKAGVGLPDTTEPVVALFSAETGNSLAWTLYLLGDELDHVSPQIRRRCLRELDERILTPYLGRSFGWMGFATRRNGRRPNNWNPWINSNVLATVLLVEPSAERRVQLVHKILRSLDNFFVPYPADGSCDEGPSYWTRAGASLFDCLELLYLATRGRLDVYDNPAVQEIGRFIYRTHIADDYFVNIGDCAGRFDIPRDVVFRYGRRIQDSKMEALAGHGLSVADLLDPDQGPSTLARTLWAIFNLSEFTAGVGTAAPLVRDVWLSHPDMQMMVARDAEGTTDGLYVAAWAGHNGQSHNHNDVGNYILYANGRPVIIDVGKPTYTRQTFSSDRYKIWAMQSAYHNLPTVNNVMQRDGRRYAAKEVAYRSDDGSAELRMDIAPAYPDEAGIVSWIRSVRLDRGKALEVTDEFQLNKAESLSENLLTVCRPSRVEPGRFSLAGADGEFHIVLEYEPASRRAEIETIPLTDDLLAEVWGPRVYRIILALGPMAPQGKNTLRFAFAQ